MHARRQLVSGAVVRGVAGLALCLGAGLAQAQAQAPNQATPAPAPARAELSPAERAQRDADKVFHWIRLSAEKPAAVARPPVVSAKPAGAPKSAPLPPRPPARAEVQTAAAPVEAAPPPTLLAVAASAPLDPPLPAPPEMAAPAPLLEAVQELPLTLLSRVEPQIPRQLLGSLQQGSVLVRLEVRPDGSVGRAEAVQATHKRLGQAAVEAVLQWRFAPISAPRQANVELGFQLE